ncbi:DUF1345 domain-containing protein [Streptomyces sp. NPDC015414]|uniref:DUF1345 domain-containing protein n=1 Tax=Streptomyces sp. NPDC015414 TaxID=3364957 RepID=UPI0036FCEA9A
MSASSADLGVVALFAYLFCHLVVTLRAFSSAPPRIRVRGPAGGAGHRAAATPSGDRAGARGVGSHRVGGAGGVGGPASRASGFRPPGDRAGADGARSRVAWACVLVAFAVAFHADNLVEDEAALDFPGGRAPAWADYVYFALSVMTTFGTRDVTVMSREMRRTVAANATIAFVFDTVIVAGMVAALDGEPGA